MPILRHNTIVSAALLMATAVLDVRAAETKGKPSREYDLKAAFLFNFAQFVEWPQDAFAEVNSPIVIGVLGDDPFGKTLDEIVANETLRNRKIVVRRCRSVQEAETCQILFISRSETSRLDGILESLDGKSVLTVGESDRFPNSGGMISFVVVQNKLRVKINVITAKAAKLTISSQLLRQAEIVDAKQGQ